MISTIRFGHHKRRLICVRTRRVLFVGRHHYTPFRPIPWHPFTLRRVIVRFK